MEDRLAILNFDDDAAKDKATVPTVRADSLSLLLTQGLQSNDSSILNVSCFLQFEFEKSSKNDVFVHY